MHAIRVLALAGLLRVSLFAAPINVTVPVTEALMAGPRIVLHIEGLKLPPNSSGIVRVFAGVPDADAQTSPEDREHFLGYFTVLPKNSKEAARGVQRAGAILDLTDKRQLLAGKKEVMLTLVPLGPREGKAQAQQKPAFSRVYLDRE